MVPPGAAAVGPRPIQAPPGRRRIHGQTVVVTGGSRGVGLGLVQRFLERDNTVITTARTASPGLAQLQQQYQAKLRLTEVDVADCQSIATWAEALKGSGVSHVDVLVNNAGIKTPAISLHEFTPHDFLTNFQTNAMGPFFVVQQLHRLGLLGGEKPSLVASISSVMASHGDPLISSKLPGRYAYRCSKAALNAINKGLAMELGDQGVECVVLHPGYVRTDMTGGLGDVGVEESTQGLLEVLESDRPLNGRFWSFDGTEIPW